MPLVAVIYVSSSRGMLSAADLDRILDQARRNNARDGITGMLLYADGSFIQAVEGPPAAVDTLLARLRADPRHSDLHFLARYEVAERQFPDWSMGFRRMTRLLAEDLAGALANLREPLFDEAAAGHSSIAHRLLEGFRRTNLD